MFRVGFAISPEVTAQTELPIGAEMFTLPTSLNWFETTDAVPLSVITSLMRTRAVGEVAAGMTQLNVPFEATTVSAMAGTTQLAPSLIEYSSFTFAIAPVVCHWMLLV